MSDIFGMAVVESPVLPMLPTPGMDARRIVRHGMADVLRWLGEEVGPRAGEPTEVLIVGNTVHASAAIVGRLRDHATRAS